MPPSHTSNEKRAPTNRRQPSGRNVANEAAPLTPAQSVLIMGTLRFPYWTMGSIETVIWTGAAQTFALLAALLAIVMFVRGADGLRPWRRSSR